MSSQRLALVMLVLGIVVGTLVGALVGPALDPSAAGGTRAAEAPLGLSPNEESRARSADAGATLTQVAARPNEARTSASGDVDGIVARAAVERIVSEPAHDSAAAATEGAWTGRITGLVVDAAGRPVSAATVTSDNTQFGGPFNPRWSTTSTVGRAWTGFQDLDESLEGSARALLERRRNARTAVTDGNGRFALEGLRPGQHWLRAYTEGLVFPQQNIFVGDFAHIVGKPVGEFHLDIRLPDGSAPAEAVVALIDERRQQSFRWTPEEPVLRLEERVAQLQVFAGEVHNSDSRTYASNYSAPGRTIDLARDGAGPHVFELTERTRLMVTLEDLSTLEPRLQPWLKVITAEAAAQGGTTAKAFEGAARLQREQGQVYSAVDLAPGAYLIGAGRSDRAPEMTVPIEIGVGKNEATVRIGELDLSRFLVARCKGPDGLPLLGVTFNVSIGQGNRTNSGGMNKFERPGGEYWLAKSDLLQGRQWSADTKLRLIASAKGFGSVESDLTQSTRELDLVFQAACELVVIVTGDLSAGFGVNIGPVKQKGVVDNPRYYGRNNGNFARVDAEGQATLSGLQPGVFLVSLSQSRDENNWGAPLATTEVVLRSGSQTVTLAAPTLYELVVHAPDVPMGTSFMLQPVDESGSPRNPMAVELDAERRARFKQVIAGEYMLIARGPMSANMRVTVPSGEVLFAAEKQNALRVAGVVPDKLAARAGLLNGDLVVSVSGRPVDGQMSAQRIYFDVQGGTSVLQVLRGGTQLELTLGPATTEQPWNEVGASFNPTTR